MPRRMNRRLPQEDVIKTRRDFYVYEATAVALATGASVNDTIQIEADSDFILQKLAYEADLAGVAQLESTQIVPNVNIQIIDTGSGRQLMQNPIPIATIFGRGTLPFILPNPRLFMRNSSLQIAFTSFEAAVTPTIRLSFIGYKVYGTV